MQKSINVNCRVYDILMFRFSLWVSGVDWGVNFWNVSSQVRDNNDENLMGILDLLRIKNFLIPLARKTWTFQENHEKFFKLLSHQKFPPPRFTCSSLHLQNCGSNKTRISISFSNYFFLNIADNYARPYFVLFYIPAQIPHNYLLSFFNVRIGE